MPIVIDQEFNLTISRLTLQVLPHLVLVKCDPLLPKHFVHVPTQPWIVLFLKLQLQELILHHEAYLTQLFPSVTLGDGHLTFINAKGDSTLALVVSIQVVCHFLVPVVVGHLELGKRVVFKDKLCAVP